MKSKVPCIMCDSQQMCAGHNLGYLLKKILMAAAIVGIAFAIPAIRQYGASLMPSRTLNVQAESKTTVQPDIATISFSVVSEGLSPKQLQDENHQKMNSVLAFVKSRSIEEKDIKTTSYNLSPRYEYDEAKRRTFISGYTLTQSVTIKIRNFDEIAKVLGGVAELGVNQISGVQFAVEDPEIYIAKARAEAFAKAREKAENIADAADIRLGRVIAANEASGPVPYYRAYEAYGKGGDGLGSAIPPTIEPGSEEVTVTVYMTFAIN